MTARISDYLFRMASQKRIPLDGTFELYPVCNFACRMCYIRRTPAQLRAEGKALIPWEDWLKLAEECRKAGTLYLLLTGGEPFLYPGFRELYTRLHQMGFILSINTNGTLLDEAAVAWLKEYAPSRVNVTLYGASAETYRRICGRADGYERAMKAIRLLKDAGIPVVINASMIPENACDLEEIIHTGRALGLNTRMATYMFPPLRRERENTDSRFSPEETANVFLRKAKCMMDAEGYAAFLEKNTAKAEAAPEDGETWGDHEEFMRCRAGRSGFWVSWEGTMTACGMIPFPLEVYPFREDFASCWSRLTDKVRSTPVLKGCAGCQKREVCKPCVALIYAETGEVNARAPYLCRMAECTLQLMREEQERDASE